MRVLIACEFSGIVRDAFIREGHHAVSCDYIVSERAGPHLFGDVREHLYTNGWDMMLAFPPCTYVCNAGLRWIKGDPLRELKQEQAIAFVQLLMAAPIPKICLENPVGILSTVIRKPDQIIQPWQFGHPEAKRTCLWLKKLPPLTHTNVLAKSRREKVVHRSWETQSESRAVARSRFYEGIATAMAKQWGTDDV